MNTNTIAQPEDRLVSLDEAARRLGVSKPKVKTMVARGELRSVTIGRRRLLAESTLQAFIRDLKERVGAA